MSSYGLSFGKQLRHNSNDVRGRKQKISCNESENQVFDLIFYKFLDCIKSYNICNALPCTTSLVKIWYKLGLIWGKVS